MRSSSLSAGCLVRTSRSSFHGCTYVTTPHRFWTLGRSPAQRGPWTATAACGGLAFPQGGAAIPGVRDAHCSHPAVSSSPLMLAVKHSLRALNCRSIDCQLLMPAFSHYSTYQLNRQKQSNSTGCWVKMGDLWFRNPGLFKSKWACVCPLSQLQ